MAVRFECNGRPIEVAEVDPHVSLLSWLRASGRTGTKEGCAEGECGACAVACIERDVHGRVCFTPVNSCLVPLAAAHDRSFVTVEGVADGWPDLHPVQAALVERGGSQCGYCTPGFVMSLFCEYYRPDRDGYDPDAISGNLCRCTGYRPIVEAAAQLTAPEPSDPHLAQLARAEPKLHAFGLRSGALQYVRPASLAELFERWQLHPRATLIAGGTDLMVYANQKHTRYETLLALDAVSELHQLRETDQELSLGAALPLSHLEHVLPYGPALLAQLWPRFSSRLIRNRATLGGNLATASPIG
ncbi:MAG: FAD binding domain-containing protein, partial [Polyangiales bacterium]